MDIERIEEWVGREVVDRDGESIGKLEEVYYRGEIAVLAEVKPGLLSRKRLLVPLSDASVTRDNVRVDYPADGLLQEASGGSGFDAEDLAAVSEHYGAAHTFEAGELESSKERTNRLAAAAERRERAERLEAEAERAREEAAAAAERADDATRDAATAQKAHEAAAQKAQEARSSTER